MDRPDPRPPKIGFEFSWRKVAGLPFGLCLELARICLVLAVTLVLPLAALAISQCTPEEYELIKQFVVNNIELIKQFVVKYASEARAHPEFTSSILVVIFGSYACIQSLLRRVNNDAWGYAALLMALFCPSPLSIVSYAIYYGSIIAFAFLNSYIPLVEEVRKHPNRFHDLSYPIVKFVGVFMLPFIISLY